MRISIERLAEPRLSFGDDHLGVEPRRQLASYGPPDGRTGRQINLGLVGFPEDVTAARKWLERFRYFSPAHEGNAGRYRDWPGAQKALRADFIIPDRFIRRLDEKRFPNTKQAGVSAMFEELLDLIDAKVQGLFGDTRPDCIVVCLPDEIADLRVQNPGLSLTERRALEQLQAQEEEEQLSLFQPTPEELKAAEELRTQADDLLFRTFYRALKARVMRHINPVPLQIIRRSTVERRDNEGQSFATRAWNLAVSLYYKSGGLPWRPADLPANVCFVGVSFHHLKRRAESIVYASVAQAFSTEIEPFALKGVNIPHDQKRDRHPYLRIDQARALATNVLREYEARAGVHPDRLVIHKTSGYQPEEIEGFTVAASGIVPAVDLVWLRSTSFRLLRKGTQEPVRGTLCTVGEEHYLFTSGFIPWWKEYPGPHIPAPIQIGAAIPTDLRRSAQEVLALSKMNWNASEGISRYPITISFAKRVGQVMTELPDSQDPNPSYRFYM
jgi:hypothetical protein